MPSLNHLRLFPNRLNLLGWVWVLGCFVSAQTSAQVQLQLTPFGKNQRQQTPLPWKIIESRGDRVYYHQPWDSTARWIARILPGLSSSLEQQLNVQPADPYQVILFQSRQAVVESNLNREKYYYNTGWNFPAPGNKVAVFPSGSTHEMVEQIREGIVRVLVAELLYGGNSWQRIQNQALLVLPSWFTEGYARYRGAGWKGSMDRELRSWLIEYPRAGFGELVRSRPDLAGVLFWHRYALMNGSGGTARLLNIARSHRQVQSAFRSLNTMSYSVFVGAILAEYRNEAARDSTALLAAKDILALPGKPYGILGPLRSDAKGRHLAFVAYQRGRISLYAYDRSTKETTRLFRGEPVRSVALEDFPLMAWHPGGNRLVVVLKEMTGLRWLLFSRNSEKVWTMEERPLRNLEMVQSLDWAPDGKTLVACATSAGRSGLWTWTSPQATPVLLWSDSLEKYDARFVPGSQSVVYAARTPFGWEPGTAKQGNGRWNGLFRLDRASGSQPQVLLSVDTETVSAPLPMGGGNLLWLSDRTGYLIRYRGTWKAMNSSAKAIPPTVGSLRWHEGGTLTNSLLLGPDPHPGSGVLALRDKIDTLGLVEASTEAENLPITFWRRQERERLLADGGASGLALDEVRPANLGFLGPAKGVGTDSPPILPDHTGGDWLPGFESNTVARMAALMFAVQGKTQTPAAKVMPYVTASSIDHVSLQAGSTLLQGRMPLLSASRLHTLHARPGALVRVGLSDMPEDRNLSAGLLVLQSFSDFQSYLMYENLSGLIDWRVMAVYSRLPASFPQSGGLNSSGSTSNPSQVWEINASATRPLGVHSGISLTLGHLLSYENLPLNPDFPKDNGRLRNQQTGMRLEWMTDRTTRSSGVLWRGIRAKVFQEFYLGSGTATGAGNLWGGDVRTYQPLLGGIVWANRLAFQHSSGKLRANYMVGGTEQWFMPRFNEDLPLPPASQVLLNGLAAPVRGLPVNTMNGSSFVGIGTEIRLIPAALRAAVPVGSEFWRNFQLAGFVDAGTAWNPGRFFQTDTTLFPTQIDRDPVSVRFDRQLTPWLWSYGVGVRAHLLGYSVRMDRAWATENRIRLAPAWILSLGLDF
ncbi:MAG: hypothetical protein ACO39U_00550 [Bacteroidia bacterium]